MYHLIALDDSTAQAILTGEPLVADCEQALGPDHPATLISRNNLAEAYRAAGRAAEAILLHEQALAARQRVLDPDHPGTCNRGTTSPPPTGPRAGQTEAGHAARTRGLRVLMNR